MTKISRLAFANNVNIKKVIIPPTVKTIEYEAFINCGNLENVVLNEGLEIIGNTSNSYRGAFENCRSLKSIIIPKTVKIIGANSFL